MYKKLYILLTITLLALGKLNAQEFQKLGSSNDRKPVLVDDSNADKLRKMGGTLTLTPQHYKLPNSLTSEQQSRINQLEIERAKTLGKLNDELVERRNALHELEAAEKVRMKAINKTIDKIAAIHSKAMKAEAAYRQSIRSLLTPQQRLEFDTMNY